MLAAAAPAQDDGKGRLTRLLESTLSDAGREVTIEGFEGALGAEARIARLSIADSQGVWLEISEAVLEWNRAALLRGRLDVERLTAARIVLSRRPEPGKPGLPAPEATPFSLPDLPVSIRIGRVAVDRLELGEAVLGRAAVLRGEGHARLADGEGDAALTLDRIDEARGQFAFEGSFANATRHLALDLSLSEGPGGIAATTLGLPGRPSLALSLDGSGPLDDFTADLALATDGTRRLGGRLALAGTDGGRRFEARLSGDLRPLVAADYRPFLGAESRLEATGQSRPDGVLVLEALDLEAGALRLTGSGALGGDRWPRRFDVSGRITPPDGATDIRLALPGAPTRLRAARFTLAYDRAAGEGWQGQLSLDGLRRPTLRVARAELSGQGQLAPGSGATPGRVTAGLDARLEGVAPDDAGLARALGPVLTGQARIDWQAGGPVRLAGLAIEAASGRLDGSGELRLAGGRTPRAALSGEGRLTLADLSRLSGLAGRPLGGSAALSIEGEAELLSGAFDLTGRGTLDDPVMGLPRLERLLAGQGRLALEVSRDEGGLTLRDLSVTAEAARLALSGRLSGDDGRAEGELEITRPGLLWPGLDGPVRLTGEARRAGREVALTLDAQGPGQAALSGTGDLTLPVADEPLRLSGQGRISVARLAAYRPILGRPVSGALDLTLAAKGEPLAGVFDLTGEGTLDDPALGDARLDALLAGQGRLALEVSRDAGGLTVNDLSFTAPAARLTLSGQLSGDQGRAEGALAITRPGVLWPGLDGPVRLTAGVRRAGREVALTLDAQGPGQAVLSGTGDLTLPAADDPLRVSGQGQLSVARLAAYRPLVGQPVAGAIDLSLSGEGTADGPARLELSGTGRDLSAGVAALDPLLAGRGAMDVALSRDEAGALTLDRAQIATAALEAAASGPLAGPLEWRVALDDLARLVPDLSGPARASGQITPDGEGWVLAARADGPGGLSARTEGRVDAQGQLDLSLSGTAPLALANGAIAPRLLAGQARFDLRVAGPPALSSLSGTASTAGASLVLPNAGLRLEAISVDLGLDGGRATIEARARPSEGGTLAASGGVSLSAGLRADLSARLDQVVLVRPGLIETVISGRLAVSGPLAGAAALSGALTIERAEIRIPDGDLAAAAALEGLQHRAPPPDVLASLKRAGRLPKPRPEGGAPARPWTLDITISAPARLFIRGRGLDAEFGGRVVVAGTTANPAPRGRFDLIRGRLDLLGRRLDLERGFVQPQGGLVPLIGLTARAQTSGVTALISIDGPADSPELSLSSTPDLPDEEILARLLFGRRLEQISPLQALRLAQAVQRLAGGGDGLSGAARGVIGLDDLDVSQSEDGATTARAGRYLSERIYSDVAVDSEGRSEIRLNLDVTRSITARGRQSSDGETGLGLFFERDY